MFYFNQARNYEFFRSCFQQNQHNFSMKTHYLVECSWGLFPCPKRLFPYNNKLKIHGWNQPTQQTQSPPHPTLCPHAKYVKPAQNTEIKRRWTRTLSLCQVELSESTWTTGLWLFCIANTGGAERISSPDFPRGKTTDGNLSKWMKNVCVSNLFILI